ncbi:MAG: hypothetical protein A2Y89_02700 [Chloroflexi bacterium RBG_13_51_18]|nr:MAG: hypothetical protein A2Y89_02700 [Chloroflexi bacterium RBG_13_51_18]
MPVLTTKDLMQRYPVATDTPEKGVIWVPPWNDIIHLVDEKTLPQEERLQKIRSRIIKLKQSPTPEIAKNIGTILTAVDDVQDFCTTIGVGARLLEKSVKLPHILSKGSFTTGALLNQLNLYNKIPWEKMDPGAIWDMVVKKKVDLDKLSPTELKSLLAATKKKYPDWDVLPEKDRQQFMRENYKMTKERWGLSLKVKKRQAEDLYGKGTPWGKIKTEVDKRLKHTAPTAGELCEIGQTSDMLSGVGISLGPLIGFAMDAVFGVLSGAELKFSKQTISGAEKKAVLDAGYYMGTLPQQTLKGLTDIGNMMIKASYLVATGQDLGVEEFLTSTWAATQGYLKHRGKELKDATLNVLDATKDWLWTMGPRTPELIRTALILEGIDPDQQEGFPGVKLKSPATMNEIVAAYTEQNQKILKQMQTDLTTTVEGEFLQSCLSAIGTGTEYFVLPEEGVAEETYTAELMIYTRACDWGLDPPIYATDQEFARWHTWIMDSMKVRNLETPTYDILKDARKIFKPPSVML